MTFDNFDNLGGFQNFIFIYIYQKYMFSSANRNTVRVLSQAFDLLAPDPSFPQPVIGSRRRRIATIIVTISGVLLCATSPGE